MKFTEVIDLILNSDPRGDWLQMPTVTVIAPIGTVTYILLDDINLRIEVGSEKIDPHTGEVIASTADISGVKWRQVCQIWYGMVRMGVVFLEAISRRDANGAFMSGPTTYVPIPRCGPKSCGYITRFDYQIARVLDLFDALDNVLEREGYDVEPALTGEQYLEQLKARQGATVMHVRSLLTHRQQTEQAAKIHPPRRSLRIGNVFSKK